MIYFFCGAEKNASHYQRFIVEEALKQRGLDFTVTGNEIFHAYKWVAGWQLLNQLHRHRGQRYLCKGHWGHVIERRLLLSVQSLQVFLIWRHLRDVMISSFHFENNRRPPGYDSFADFYWSEGRQFFVRQLLYRRGWGKLAGHPRVFQVNFEDLKQDFPAHARRMLDFAGVEGVDLKALEDQLSLERMRQTRNDPKGKFFRKGEPGEHKDFAFPQDVLEDMHGLEARSSPMLNLVLAGVRGRRLVGMGPAVVRG